MYKTMAKVLIFISGIILSCNIFAAPPFATVKKLKAEAAARANADGALQAQINQIALTPGPQGPVGQDTSKLQKRSTFNFIILPEAISPTVQLSSLTFTPPLSGSAVLKSRGYCNVMNDSATQFYGISAGVNAATAFALPASDQAFVRLQPSAFPQSIGWTTETTVAVTAGTTTTLKLFGTRYGGTQEINCSGSLQVEIYSGTLP